ncbi:hypothetical protein BU24DRAFT_417464 [Aaosphaeria arxii CBS 175.79]|uniref:AA1-like domain-containing protein n=1 Tax=Aaosphaeria arxii CBS 175.79 TaxID=1450172 RepID=A0A6A5Y8D7_9PLEO|nr:uncharacterized protein BU24DRAFT_417464 [Aaosphaeria arxii CBS 175.79]KAF2021825.1 hypothetical protein BU24DRAFT_417464 [Aaosphaeria arxii CBS 175.79]
MVSFKSIILAAFVAAPLVAAECTSFQAALAFDQGSGLDPARHEESSWDISQGGKNLCSVVMAKTSNGKQDCNDPGSSVEWQFEGEQSKGSATYCPGNGAWYVVFVHLIIRGLASVCGSG